LGEGISIMKLLYLLKKRWLRWNVRKASAGDAAAMNRLYLFEDPWGLNTTGEHFRFQETARIIRENIGDHFESILEIGCGEGLQTQYLAPLARYIVGLDPSSNAIKRARARGIANASFKVGELTSYAGLARGSFDLVMACEVLYYMPDFEEAFEKLNKLGSACVVTYHRGVFESLDNFFSSKKVISETIRGADCDWRVVYWRLREPEGRPSLDSHVRILS